MNRALKHYERVYATADFVECPQCNGSGEIVDPWKQPDRETGFIDPESCTRCLGEGFLFKNWNPRFVRGE